MKIKTLFVCFFKCSFLKRVCAVIFELDEVSTSNFVKFPLQRMTLKVERVFEKNKQNIESKTGQNGHELRNQKGPQPMQNFLHEEKIPFFVRFYHFILLKTSVW